MGAVVNLFGMMFLAVGIGVGLKSLDNVFEYSDRR